MTEVPGLDPVVRAAVARHVLEVLAEACPGGRADLRGSLAAGTADPYSDIDAVWTVPDDRFGTCVDRAGDLLARVRPLMSLRGDPDTAGTPGRRLLFVAFEGLPPFWRLDLDIAAEPGAAPSDPTVRHPWPPAASALANGVAAVKALHRGDPATAHALLTRAYPRVGLPPHPTGRFPDDLAALTRAALALDPTVGAQAAALTALPLP
ncbi:hypothetical protein OG896_35140 [Streptomyces sp. NBC_00669]|uniref:hypothetical protein n=1 Tax=Streptomyces sp. NBC_00669 TaxID=2976011 RepID=UPI002E2F42D0|nr:hypothetical protein [Streptomyces sp. NBC_00669]